MRQAMPPISERAAEPKERLQREHDGHKKSRLQMLYRLASGHAHERQEVARLLGLHRKTIGRSDPGAEHAADPGVRGAPVGGGLYLRQ
jgi:hypothetical protein